MTDAQEGFTKRYTIRIDQDKVGAVIAMTKERLGSPDPGVPFDEDDLFRQFIAETLSAELFSGEVLSRLELKWRGYVRDPAGYPLKIHFIVRDDGGDVMCGQNLIGELIVTWMDYRSFDPVNDRAMPPDDEEQPHEYPDGA